MSILSDWKSHLKIAFVGGHSAEHRLFALLEVFCQPVSFLTLLGIPAIAVCRRCGAVPPPWFANGVFPVMLAAAIGYLTNWLAIEMLFKPYRKTLRHPFAWLTLGYWRQGLVPKNKAQIADTIGRTVSQHLLKPEELANDICDMLWSIIGNREQLRTLQTSLLPLVADRRDAIKLALAHQLENDVAAALDNMLSPQAIHALWDTHIQPRLASDEIRDKMAGVILQAVEKRVPDIAAHIRPQLAQAISAYGMEKAGPFWPMLQPMVGGLVDKMLSDENMQSLIGGWLHSPETRPSLRNDLALLVDALGDTVKSPENTPGIADFADGIRAQLASRLDSWLDERLVPMATALLQSEQLTDGIAAALQNSRPALDETIRAKAIPAITEKLNIQERIRAAIDRQDMAEFHGMVNAVAAQHLGAIQVLGYILGALAGACLQLAI